MREKEQELDENPRLALGPKQESTKTRTRPWGQNMIKRKHGPPGAGQNTKNHGRLAAAKTRKHENTGRLASAKTRKHENTGRLETQRPARGRSAEPISSRPRMCLLHAHMDTTGAISMDMSTSDVNMLIPVRHLLTRWPRDADAEREVAANEVR